MPSRLPCGGPREPCRGLAGRRDHVGAFADPPAAAVTAPDGWRTKFQMQRQCPLVGRENCPRRDGKGPGAATCDQRDNGHLETRYQAGGGAECREVHSRGDSCSYSHLKARRGKDPPTPSIVGRMRFLEGRGSEAALLSLSPGPLRWAVASRKRAPRRAKGRRRGSHGPGRPGLPRAVSLGGNRGGWKRRSRPLAPRTPEADRGPRAKTRSRQERGAERHVFTTHQTLNRVVELEHH